MERLNYTPEELKEAFRYVHEIGEKHVCTAHAGNWRSKFTLVVESMTKNQECLKLLTRLLDGHQRVSGVAWYKAAAERSAPPLPKDRYERLSLVWQLITKAVPKSNPDGFDRNEKVDLPYVLVNSDFPGGSLGERFEEWRLRFLEPWANEMRAAVDDILSAIPPGTRSVDLWDAALAAFQKPSTAAAPGPGALQAAIEAERRALEEKAAAEARQAEEAARAARAEADGPFEAPAAEPATEADEGTAPRKSRGAKAAGKAPKASKAASEPRKTPGGAGKAATAAAKTASGGKAAKASAGAKAPVGGAKRAGTAKGAKAPAGARAAGKTPASKAATSRGKAAGGKGGARAPGRSTRKPAGAPDADEEPAGAATAVNDEGGGGATEGATPRGDVTGAGGALATRTSSDVVDADEADSALDAFQPPPVRPAPAAPAVPGSGRMAGEILPSAGTGRRTAAEAVGVGVGMGSAGTWSAIEKPLSPSEDESPQETRIRDVARAVRDRARFRKGARP